MNKQPFPPANFAGSVLAGLPAPLIFFVAGSAFETPGRNSPSEMIGALIFGGLYLAFAQFWVVPRGLPSLKTAWPSVLGAIIPLIFCVLLIGVLENPDMLWQLGLPCLVAGVTAGFVGAWLARRATATSAELAPGAAPAGHSAHRCLLMGLALLIVATLITMFGAVPLVLERTAPGFNTPVNVLMLRIAAVLELLAATGLAIATWRSDLSVRPPKTLLGPVAFCALLLGLVDVGMGALCAGYLTLRDATVWLWLGAAANLASAALVTFSSVLDDRHSAVPPDHEHHPPPASAPPITPVAG